MSFFGVYLSNQHNVGVNQRRGEVPSFVVSIRGIPKGGRNRNLFRFATMPYAGRRKNLPAYGVAAQIAPCLLLPPAAAGRNSPGVLSLFVHFLFARAKRKWTPLRANRSVSSHPLHEQRENGHRPGQTDTSQGKTKTQGGNESRPAFVVILPFSSPVSGRSSSPSRRA